MSKDAKNDKSWVRPRVDVLEGEAELMLVADMAGVGREAIDVRFDDGDLTITGGRFWRTFAMPDGVDPEKIAAEYTNGVLTVHVPKAAAKRARRIDVRAG
jgi:HSP20 family molecular chaperone IbpA